VPDWVVTILQGYGLAGVVIAALAIAVWTQNKNAVEVNNARLSERDVLIKALEANTTAIRENARVTEARNIVTQDLAEAISKQAGAFDVFLQKTEFHQTNIKDQMQAQNKLFEAFSESNRVNTGTLRDIRDYIERQPS
jgi:hypothetical protein